MAANGRPGRREREKLQQQESLSDGETVLADPRGSANYGYAYHRIGKDGTPLCRPDADGLEKIDIQSAQERGKVPCGMCERIMKQKD